MTRLRRMVPSMSVLAAVVAGSTVFLPGPAGAEAFSGVFRAKATASGVRVTFIVPKGSVSDTIADVGAPASEALLDSLGESRAFASIPYPGDLPSNAPGLLRGLAGIPAPDYPFYVSSFYPSRPRQQAGLGPYLIAAESNDTMTTATADVGYHDEAAGSIGALRATTSAASQPDGVVAEATDEITSFAIGPLKIGQVLSTARVQMAPDGTLTRQADTRVVGAMAGDTPVTITAKGIQVAGSPVANPVPADALAQAGITVSLTAVTDLPDGVVAPALRITYRTSNGSSLNYEVGSASATVQGTASGASPPPAAEESGPGGNASDAPPPVVTDPARADAPPAADAGGIDLPPDAKSPVAAAGGDDGATPMWLDTSSAATAAARALLPTGPETSPVAGSAPVPTALVAPSRPVASITRVSLLTHLINGGNLEPLFGVALILFAAGSALLLAGIRRASVR